MYAEHPKFDTPPDETVLWRYMDLAKFLAMVSTRTIYARRVDQFEDKWEGAVPPTFIRRVKDADDHAAKVFLQSSDRMRERFFVNCWHASTCESAALWSIYGSAGLAVRSTVGRLKQAIRSVEFYLASVRYCDYEIDDWFDGNAILPCFMKRKSFEFEQEVRVVVWADTIDNSWDRRLQDPSTVGVELEVDIAELIESVYVSPTASPALTV